MTYTMEEQSKLIRLPISGIIHHSLVILDMAHSLIWIIMLYRGCKILIILLGMFQKSKFSIFNLRLNLLNCISMIWNIILIITRMNLFLNQIQNLIFLHLNNFIWKISKICQNQIIKKMLKIRTYNFIGRKK